jgi:AmiR/NasT family two-component response regulator
LTTALATRDLIGQAKGMLMVLLSLSEDGSWRLLVRLSQTTNRKVHDVAAALVAYLTRGTPLPDDVRDQLGGGLPSGGAANR